MNPHGGGNQMREPALPAAVGAELERLEARLGQLACAEARRQLAELGEPAAARVLRAIGEARQVRTLSGFIRHMANQERMKRNARGIPTAHSAACISGPCREGEGVCCLAFFVHRLFFSHARPIFCSPPISFFFCEENPF